MLGEKKRDSGPYAYIAALGLGHFLTDLNQGGVPALLATFKDTYGLSYTLMGVILAVSNLTSSVAQPVFGYLTDAKRRRYLMPLGLLLATLGFAMLGLAKSFGQVLVAVAFSGLGVAAFHPEASKSANRVAGSGRVGASTSLFLVGGNAGTAMGPLLAAFYLAHMGLRGTVWNLSFGLPAVAVLALLLPGIAAAEARATGGTGRRKSERAAWLPEIVLLVVVGIRSFIQYGLTAFVPLYYHARNVPGSTAVILFSLLGAVAIGNLIGGHLADRLGQQQVLLAATAFLVPAILAAVVSAGWVAVVALAAVGLLIGAMYPVTLNLSQRFLPSYLGLASGLNIGFSVGIGGIGAVVLGRVADGLGLSSPMWVIAAMPVVALLLVILLPRETIVEAYKSQPA